MALIKCSECGTDISDKAVSCPKCGYPLHKTEENQVPQKGKNKGKTFLISGGIMFFVFLVFGLATTSSQVGLNAKRLSRGLSGAEALEWMFLRYVPNIFLWISVILVVIGIILLVTARKDKQ